MPAAHDFLERLESGTAEACSQPAPDTLETQLPLTGSAAATFLDSVECAESYPVSSAAVDPAEGANTLTASPACPAALPASGGCGETAGHSVAATAPQTPELEGTAALIGYPASEGIAAAAAGVAAAAVLAADLEIATASAAESGGGEAEAAGALLTSRSSMQTSLAGVASPHATEVPTIEFALHELRLDDEQWGVLDGAGISELWIDLRLVVLPQPWRSGRVRFPTRRTPGGVLALKLSSAAGQLDFPHDSSAASVLRNALIADDVDASSVVLSLHGARGGAGDVGARLAEATLSLRQMARSMPLPAHALPARAHCPHTRCARTRSPNTRCSEARYPHLPASASICSVGWWRTTSGVTAQRVLPSVHRAAHAASLTSDHHHAARYSLCVRLQRARPSRLTRPLRVVTPPSRVCRRAVGRDLVGRPLQLYDELQQPRASVNLTLRAVECLRSLAIPSDHTPDVPRAAPAGPQPPPPVYKLG